MSVIDTLLVFVGIPAAIIAAIWIAVYGKSLMRQPNRYRPGRPWDFPPTWYVPHPDAVVQARAATNSSDHPSTTAVGGASGEW
jgi:hypothetical protein